MRSSLIDVGSNTIKALIAEIDEHGAVKIIDELSAPCRLLASKSQLNWQIDETSSTRLIECLKDLLARIGEVGVDHVRVVGTEALRLAENSNSVIERTRLQTGLKIEVLSGEQEARAVANGLLSEPALSRMDSFLALDLGGGSLELIEVSQRKPSITTSLPIGAVALANLKKVDLSKAISEELIESLRQEVDEILQTNARDFIQPQRTLAGCGGTIVFLRRLLEQREERPSASEITLEEVDHYLERSAGLDLNQRIAEYPILPPGRADVFPFGLIALSTTMRFLGQQILIHSYRNLRHGLIFEGLAGSNGSSASN